MDFRQIFSILRPTPLRLSTVLAYVLAELSLLLRSVLSAGLILSSPYGLASGSELAIGEGQTEQALIQARQMSEIRQMLFLGTDFDGNSATPTREQSDAYHVFRDKNWAKYGSRENHPCKNNLDSDRCIYAAFDQIYFSKDMLTPDEIDFVAAFKSHLMGMVQMQNVRINELIECLEIEKGSQVTQLYALRHDFAATCEQFRRFQIPELFEAYKNMKVNLALSQANKKVMPLKMDKHSLTQLEWPDVGRQTSNEEFAGVYCNIFKYPLRWDGTDFCTENLRILMNANPKHTAIRFQLKWLHKFFDNSGDLYDELPEIKELEPLTYFELATASELYQSAYNSGVGLSRQFGNYKTVDTEGMDKLEIADIENKKNFLRYSSARWLMGDHAHNDMFFEDLSKFTEGVDYPAPAEHEYAEIINENPFLVFLDLPTRDIEVSCENGFEYCDCPSGMSTCSEQQKVCSSVDYSGICEAWKRQITSRGLKPQTYDVYEYHADGITPKNTVPLRKAIKEALAKALATNELLQKRMNNQFNIEELIEDLDPHKELDNNNVSHWMRIMAFEQELEDFISLHPGFEPHIERLQNAYLISDMYKAAGEISAAFAGGLACGAFMLFTRVPLPTCLALGVAGGLGINVAFYAKTYKEYQNRFMEYFSSPEKEFNLIDLELVSGADKALLWEMAFIFIGTGISPTVKPIAKLIQQSTQAAKGKLARFRDGYNRAGPGGSQ